MGKKIKLVESLAGTGKAYAVGSLSLTIGEKTLKLGDVQVRLYSPETLHIQLNAGPVLKSIGSRNYGGVLEVTPTKVFIKALPDDAKE